MQQRSNEWFAARCGYITASRFKSVISKIKSGESAERKTYKTQIALERITGNVIDGYQNEAMRWGEEMEFAALCEYQLHTGLTVDSAGFIKLAHDSIKVGASPDGLIGKEGGIEIKCPFNSMVHIETILNGMPTEHRAQVQGAMWVTGASWWDFVSYDPRLPDHLQIYIERVERDQKYIDKLHAAVIEFDDEVNDLVNKLSL